MAANATSVVLIQGTKVPGGSITVNVPTDASFATDCARQMYYFPGAQYIWKGTEYDQSEFTSEQKTFTPNAGSWLLVGVVAMLWFGATIVAPAIEKGVDTIFTQPIRNSAPIS